MDKFERKKIGYSVRIYDEFIKSEIDWGIEAEQKQTHIQYGIFDTTAFDRNKLGFASINVIPRINGQGEAWQCQECSQIGRVERS